jgi:hypothetical protein
VDGSGGAAAAEGGGGDEGEERVLGVLFQIQPA